MLALAVCALLVGCGGGSANRVTPSSELIYTLEEAQQPAKWTVLVYLDADNDLEDAGIRNFNQMEAAGSTRDVHIIVQMDRMTGDDYANSSWTDTRRYLITRDSDKRVMHSVRLDQPQLGELDMADADTLRDFVQWGKSQFPADHYLLIVWDHGSGWRLRALTKEPRHRTIAVDDTSGNQMNITDLADVLTGLKVDVLAFDACYMQQLEVAYEVKDCADFLVGSAATEPSPGYNYLRLLGNISGATTPTEMCQTIVAQYAAEYPDPMDDITQSAIDLSRIDDVATAASDLASLLIPQAHSLSSALAAARNQCLDYSPDDDYYSRDLIDYGMRCATAVGPSANTVRLALESAVSSAVICSTHNNDMPNAHGLAIYVPPPHSYSHRYPELSFAGVTQWDEWLQTQRE